VGKNVFGKKPEGKRSHFENLGIVGRIIFKYILKYYGGRYDVD
jgi:hypothetical protein